MSGAVNWSVARTVAVRFSGTEPFSESYLAHSLVTDFDELTAKAQTLVESYTGWSSSAGPARARVTDRAGWIDANIASFQRLMRPLTERFEQHLAAGLLAPVAGRIVGAEVGLILGWMSTRVLGQYDMLVLEDEQLDDQDLVYYVGPNILSLEKRFAFPPREFRLWVALHEVTHRTQFTGVPWLRGYFLDQVSAMVGSVEPDATQIFQIIGRIAAAVRSQQNPLAEGGLAALFASPEQKATLDRIGGLMSLLEGHGDVTMDRAGGDEIPSAPRFGQVLRQRRNTGSSAAKLLQKLIGLEAKLAQYEQGEQFIETVEKAGGKDYVDRAFESASELPTLAEIRDPQIWMERVRPPATSRS